MLKRKDLQIIANVIDPQSKVLDLGCGDGQLLNELINNKDILGFGIEISLTRIKKCLEKGISVVQEDLNEGLKEFQRNSFDYVILSQTLEYISKPLYLIQEMLRVGNKCIISFENMAYWKKRFNFFLFGSLEKRSKSKGTLLDGKKQLFLSVKEFLRLSNYYNLHICKKLHVPNKRMILSRIFPNLFSKVAIFVIKSK
ncbi:MAG: methionine biosynthesis protein MetW [Promethearchaeota archaeon]